MPKARHDGVVYQHSKETIHQINTKTLEVRESTPLLKEAKIAFGFCEERPCGAPQNPIVLSRSCGQMPGWRSRDATGPKRECLLAVSTSQHNKQSDQV